MPVGDPTCFGLIGRVGDHHNVPWTSRDYHLSVPCKRAACPANRADSCIMASAIRIGANGVCETGSDLIALTPKPAPRPLDGD